MENKDFMDEGMYERIQNFEKMLQSGQTVFYDNEELQEIIDFYLDFEEIAKANQAIAFAETLFPFDTFYKIKKAEIYIAERNIVGAVKLLEKYKSIEPNNPEIAKLLGDCYAISLQYKRAEDSYLFALQSDPHDEELLLRLARISFALAKNKKALSYINAVPDKNEYDELSIQEFVRLFMDYNEYQEAIIFLDKIIDTNPYMYGAWYFKGLVYQRTEEYLKAVDAYEFCIAIDDSNTMGFLGKGNCLLELAEYEKAIEAYHQSLDGDDTDAEVLCNIAECYENLKDDVNAQSFYMKSISTNPNLSDAYFGLAMVFKRKNNFLAAERNLKQAIQIDKYESLYYIELAEIYLQLGEKEKCYENYQNAYDLDSETTEILLDYAHSMVEMEEVGKAVDLLMEHLENHDEDYRIYYRIAAYAYIIGKNEQANNFLHAALKMNPKKYMLLYEFAPFLENVENVSNIIDLYTN